jgi:hypothetical protein
MEPGASPLSGPATCMKKISFTLLLLAALTGTACKETPARQEQHTEATTRQAAATGANLQMAYICPMNCDGSASNKPGKCLVCDMELQKNPDYHAAADSAAQPAR